MESLVLINFLVNLLLGGYSPETTKHCTDRLVENQKLSHNLRYIVGRTRAECLPRDAR